MIKETDNHYRIGLAIDSLEQLMKQLELRFHLDNEKKWGSFSFRVWLSDIYYAWLVTRFNKVAKEIKTLLETATTFPDEIESLITFNDFIEEQKDFIINIFTKTSSHSQEDPIDLYNIYTYGGKV